MQGRSVACIGLFFFFVFVFSNDSKAIALPYFVVYSVLHEVLTEYKIEGRGLLLRHCYSVSHAL